MQQRDLEAIGGELLRIVARAGVRAAARGTQSVLADAQRGAKILVRRLDKAIATTRDIESRLRDSQVDEEQDDD